jgi:hypothetical protein
MKRLFISVLSIFLISLTFSVNAVAQSSKFAAVWSEEAMALEVTACASTEADFCDPLSNFDQTAGYTMANIRVPQAKELLVGVSAQVGLFTSTQVKGKKGSYSYALAAAGGSVVPFACNVDTLECTPGAPGTVVLDARIQEMEAVLAGIIEECTFSVSLDVAGIGTDQATGDATWNLGQCEVAQEEISLALSTLRASHFNFVFPDLDQGDYAIVAYFVTAAAAAAMANCPAESAYCAAGDGDATAISHAFIGKTMMTVQEVRAVKNELDDMTIVPLD